MNPTKQFWTLVKFQYVLSPLLWFLPLIAGFSSLIPFLIAKDSANSNYHPDLSLFFFTNQGFFFVCIFGSMIISPEKFQFSRMKSVDGYTGTEFLLTRAVDRPVLCRSRAFLLYLLFLLLPACTVLYFLPAPNLIVRESSKAETQQVLAHIPQTVLVPESNPYMQPSIAIPLGKVLIAEWQLWTMILAILALQFFVFLFYPYKYGPPIFWMICYGSLFVPILLPMRDLGKHAHGVMSPAENLFFFFAENQSVAWIGAAFAVVLCQLWCERRFARMEF